MCSAGNSRKKIWCHPPLWRQPGRLDNGWQYEARETWACRGGRGQRHCREALLLVTNEDEEEEKWIMIRLQISRSGYKPLQHITNYLHTHFTYWQSKHMTSYLPLEHITYIHILLINNVNTWHPISAICYRHHTRHVWTSNLHTDCMIVLQWPWQNKYLI